LYLLFIYLWDYTNDKSLVCLQSERKDVMLELNRTTMNPRCLESSDKGITSSELSY
jgi:hypothetical protein